MPPLRPWLVALLLAAFASGASADAFAQARTETPSPAKPTSPADDKKAQKLFDRGNRSYDRGRYADALADYRASYEAAPRAATLFNLAQTEARLGFDESAYVRFLELVDRADAPVKLRTLAKGQLADLLKRLRVPVQIASDPPGAQVFIDGAAEATGTTPLLTRVAPGSHEVRVAHGHAPPVVQKLEAEVGRDVTLSVTLEVTAQVRVVPTPADAHLCAISGGIDGLPKCQGRGPEGPTGTFTGRVKPGRYVIAVRADGYAPRSLELVAERAGVISHDVGLAPLSDRMGVLQVGGTPDATVIVDDKPVGTTPLEHVSMPAGSYSVTVKRRGHRAWSGRARVASGQTTRLVAELVPERARWANLSSEGLVATGAFSLALGSLIGILAMQDHALYGEEPTRDRANRGSSRAFVADTLFLVGGLTLGSGITIWLTTSPAPSSARVEVPE